MTAFDIQNAIGLLEQGRTEEAIPLLCRMTDTMPVYVTAYVLLARAYEAEQQWRSALDAWHRAQFLMPDSPIVRAGIEQAAERLAAPAWFEVPPPESDTPAREAPAEAAPTEEPAQPEEPEEPAAGQDAGWHAGLDPVPLADAEPEAEPWGVPEPVAGEPAPEDVLPVPEVAPWAMPDAAAGEPGDEWAGPWIEEPLLPEEVPEEEPVPEVGVLAVEVHPPEAVAPPAGDADGFVPAASDVDLAVPPAPDEDVPLVLTGHPLPPQPPEQEDDFVDLTEAPEAPPVDPSGAWLSFDLDEPADRPLSRRVPSDFADLDRLIDELESARIVPRPDVDAVPPPELEDDIEDVVSETLARIYASQRQFDEAARVYELLSAQQPERADEFLRKASEMRARADDR